MLVFQGKHRPLELMRLAGLFTWFCASIPLLFSSMLRHNPLPQEQYIAWWVLQLLYGLVYWHLTRFLGSNMLTKLRLIYLFFLTVSPAVQADLAQQFVEWLLSVETQELIASFKVNGDQLFTPNSEAWLAAQPNTE